MYCGAGVNDRKKSGIFLEKRQNFFQYFSRKTADLKKENSAVHTFTIVLMRRRSMAIQIQDESIYTVVKTLLL